MFRFYSAIALFVAGGSAMILGMVWDSAYLGAAGLACCIMAFIVEDQEF